MNNQPPHLSAPSTKVLVAAAVPPRCSPCSPWGLPQTMFLKWAILLVYRVSWCVVLLDYCLTRSDQGRRGFRRKGGGRWCVWVWDKGVVGVANPSKKHCSFLLTPKHCYNVLETFLHTYIHTYINTYIHIVNVPTYIHTCIHNTYIHIVVHISINIISECP